MRTWTTSFCEDCDWRDPGDVASRADRHSRQYGHVTHTLTLPLVHPVKRCDDCGQDTPHEQRRDGWFCLAVNCGAVRGD